MAESSRTVAANQHLQGLGVAAASSTLLSRVKTTEVAHFLAIVAQLGLVLWAMYTFRVEESFGLPRILPLIFVGFIVNAALPLRFRRPFFLLLSLAAIGTVFGPEYGTLLVGLGLVLIAICHLPVRLSVRVSLLLVVGALLAGIRAEWIPVPFGRMPKLPTLVLPILGSMFMFRLIVYLYDLRHEKKPATLAERLSYFFLLPNVCFPLFPVVDYTTYRRTYYDAPSLEIYEKGVQWIFRGMIHLLLYRLVYLYLVPTPAEVQTLGGVVQMMTATYLLYLRVSGQFHLIVGILCLFGFNLPETHRLYFLASSFTDYWRRINIYWKDFMMKIFYYPSLMKLRRFGVQTAMVLSTLLVFAGTWILHSYQWFWLRGTFPITGPDALFWGILGALVVANSLYEMKRGRKRSLGTVTGWSLREALLKSIKTVGMVVLITILWSVWSSGTVGEWVALLSAAQNTGAGGYVALLFGLLILVGSGVLLHYVVSRREDFAAIRNLSSMQWSRSFATVTALSLVAIGAPQTRSLWGESTAMTLTSLTENRLNERDAELLDRGYYEGLVSSESYTNGLLEIRRPADWDHGARNSHVVRQLSDVLEYELIPSYQGRYKEADFQVNEAGMRDHPYPRVKSPGTLRIGLLGASYEMGAGVGNDQTFENVLEQRLNAEAQNGEYEAYQILNFAVGGYSVVHNVVVAERKAFDFDPDMLVLAIHATEDRRLRIHLRTLVENGTVVPYPFLREAIAQSGATADMKTDEITRRLEPFVNEVMRWSFREIATRCRERGVPCVAVYIPTTEEIRGLDRERFALVTEFARKAGFLILSLDGAYDSTDLRSIQLAAWDTHPSAMGHRLLADRFYKVLRENEDVLKYAQASSAPQNLSQSGSTN